MTFRIDVIPLAIIFAILKLFGAIDWSWWWVLSPIWIGYGILLAVAITIGVLHCLEDRK